MQRREGEKRKNEGKSSAEMGVMCTAELPSQAKHGNRVKQPFPVLFCWFSGSAPYTSARRL